MIISFTENQSIINQTNVFKMGRLLCTILNDTQWETYRNFEIQLDFFLPMADQTAQEYIDILENNIRTIDIMLRSLNEDAFYRLSDEPENTFVPIRRFFSGIIASLRKRTDTGTELMCNLDVDIDEEAYQKALNDFHSFYEVHAEAVRRFTRFIDDVMLSTEYDSRMKPAERLNAYGYEKFKSEVWKLVMQSRTASESLYTPDYEYIAQPNGTYQLVCAISVNNIAQFMYHEFMYLVMHGHSIRRCKNCGRFFIQYGDRVVDYCDNVPDSETRPCSVIGSMRHFQASLQSDLIKQTYIRTYKKYTAQRRAKTITAEQFSVWAERAKGLRAQAYAAEMSPVVFQHTLDELMTEISQG